MKKYGSMNFNQKVNGLEEERIKYIKSCLELLSKNQLPDNWSWVKSSDNTVVAKYNDLDNKQEVYYKKYLDRSLLEGIKSRIRGSRCQRSIKQGELLVINGFRTPEVVCWGQKEDGEFVVTKAIQGYGYGDYINELYKTNKGGVNQKSNFLKILQKRNLLSSIGSLVGQLHVAGIVHGDLRPNNILVTINDLNIEFNLIDNERNKIYKKIPEKLLIKNLVQIMMFFPEDLSITYRFRFYKKYFEELRIYNLSNQKRIMMLVHNIVSKRLEGRDR